MKKNLASAKRKSPLLFIFRASILLLLTCYAFAQQLQASDNFVEITPVPDFTVSGRVVDNTGLGLPGVNIVVKGTSIGTATDPDGYYTIQVPSETGILEFSFIGMITQEVPIEGRSTINVTLQEDVAAIEEVVAIGYQTIHTRNLTSSVARISSEELSNIPVSSIASLLGGHAAGVQSVITSGAPGARGSVVIRGNTAISGQLDPNTAFSNPLYVVDGIPTTIEDLAGYDMSHTDFLASLNPDDIESIDILKDASAAAIYGSRGANGVIIINTRRGTVGEPEFSVNSYVGVTQRPELLNMLVGGAERDMKMFLIDYWWNYDNKSQNIPIMLTDSLNPSFNNNHDYQGMFYQPGFTQNHTFNVSGGTESTNYRVGLGYFTEDGIIKATGFDRYTMSLNLNTRMGQSFRNQATVRFSSTDTKTGQGTGNPRNALPVNANNLNSSLFAFTDTQRELLEGRLEALYNKNTNMDVSLSNFAVLDINAVPGLGLNSQIGVSYWNNKVNFFQPSTVRGDGRGYASYTHNSRQNYSVETYLTYTKNVNTIHDFNVLLGNSIDYNRFDQLNINATGGSGDAIKVVRGFSQDEINGITDISTNAMLSFWARFGYRLLDRYLIDFNYRRDASSRFGKDTRWGDFPSIAAAWIFSDEPWLEPLTGSWLDFAKLKFSWGINGKQFTDNFLRYNVYTTYGLDSWWYGHSIGSQWSNQMSVNTYNSVIAGGPDFRTIANDQLGWENSRQWNAGVELDMFGRRLTVSFDAYNKLTDQLLFQVDFPKYSGYVNAQANVAGVLNYGYEGMLSAQIFPRTAPFRWDVTLHMNRNWNFVSGLPNGGRDFRSGNYGYTVGQPMNQFFMFRYEGVVDYIEDLPVNPFTGEHLTGKPAWARLQPGFPYWTDITGTYEIQDERDGDLQVLPEKSANPHFQGALNTTMMWRGWALSMNTQFIFGRDIVNQSLQQYLARYDLQAWGWPERGMIDINKEDYWWEPGDGMSGRNVRYPALRPVGGSGMPTYYAFRAVSGMFFEDGSYFKLQSGTLSYNFDENRYLQNMFLKRLRVYATVYNIWQWQASDEIVDASMVDALGYAYGNGYPQPRKYILGLNFRF